jgi:hypothetical protein
MLKEKSFLGPTGGCLEHTISVRSYKPKEITKSVHSIFVKTLKMIPFGWLNNVIQQ